MDEFTIQVFPNLIQYLSTIKKGNSAATSKQQKGGFQKIVWPIDYKLECQRRGIKEYLSAYYDGQEILFAIYSSKWSVMVLWINQQ